ncbi:MAG: hypothetical protein WC558_13605 [Patulibacter sp.]
MTVAECTINYGCTLVLGRRHWKGLPSYSLPLLCDAVGVSLVDHHDALSDARACSGLASRLLDELGVSSIEEAAAELRVSLGQVGAKDIRCLSADIRAPMPQPNVDADPDHPFFGRCVSFTGALLQWTRAEAASLVAARGGIASEGVTKQTNYLVTGDQDPVKLRGKPMSGKAAKAALYASGGQEIEVLTELDFTRLLLG